MKGKKKEAKKVKKPASKEFKQGFAVGVSVEKKKLKKGK